ncbi:MAG: rod shape-determining protein MreB [Polaromonas sp.]|nr:rod shape-determining protein MreB [Polaromonas sp.]
MFDFLAPPLYIRLTPYRLSVRNVKTGKTLSEVPEIALSRGPNPRILDVGAKAALHRSSKAAEVLNPFSHPRTLISDFSTGQRVLKAFIRKLNRRQGFSLAPRVVLHPQGEPAGGYTQIEIRAFHEMVHGAGASSATLWQGPELTDAQVLSRRFPTSGQVLE